MPIVDPGWCWARSPSAPTAAFASARRSRRAPATPREAGQGGGHRRHGHRRPAVSGSDGAGRRARQPVRGRLRRVRPARCPRVLAEVLEDVLADLWSGERFAAAAGPCAATRSPSWPSPRPRIPLWVACTWPNGGRCGAPPLGRGGGRLAESPGSWERMEPDQVAKLAEIRRRRAVRLVAVNPALPMRRASPPTPPGDPVPAGRLAGGVARAHPGRPARRGESAAQTAPCRRVQRP